jgi:hypothetical protein
MTTKLWAGIALTAALGAAALAGADELQRNFAGSIQIDYMAVPTKDVARDIAFDGATLELSMKLAIDFGPNTSANVKVCYACHGFEVGMAFFDVRVADQLNFRVGRFTPSFGEFPLRHDPANHRTSDKPLPYDMGRMLRLREFNEGILPAPWVDNGLEVSGTQYFQKLTQFDYAVYAIMGPKANTGALDFDFIQSRTPYYLDNNSRPTVGGRVAFTLGLGEASSVSLGASGMYGTYDPENKLHFLVAGGDLVLRLTSFFFRTEYLIRRTEMDLGPSPQTTFRYGPGKDGVYDNFFVKDGFYSEIELPAGRFDFVARIDGLRRRGNVPISSPLRSTSEVLRYTAAATYRIWQALRIKLSYEFYDFSDFSDESVIHLGLAGPF